MHVSSLPGKYAIGDFGPEAYTFVKKLKQAGQKCWQLLPLNPIERSKGFSPYSPLSAFAGNILFISPEILLSDKYLSELPDTGKDSTSFRVDYKKALGQKIPLLLKD